MSVLDDAIRDHLELKRRHGADPGEVAHLERRALGPDGDALADVPGGEPDSEGANGASGSAGVYGEPRPPRDAAGTAAPGDDGATGGGKPAFEHRERSSGFAPRADGRGATSDETIEIDTSSLAASENDGVGASSFLEDR